MNAEKNGDLHVLFFVITGKNLDFSCFFSPVSGPCRLFLQCLPFFITVSHRRSQNSCSQTDKVTILCFRVKLGCQVLQATTEKR